MKKAREIMTSALVTCAPDTPIAQVSQLMRDRDTGNVLVEEHSKLLGILTDRDIVVRMASKHKDPQAVRAKELMTSHVITGQADWNIDKLAKTMSKHQIRRLPILDQGMLVGIVSLGDLARYDEHEGRIAKSLKQISEPGEVHRIHWNGHPRAWATAGLGLLTAVAMIFTLSPNRLKSLRRQIQSEHVPNDMAHKLARVRERIFGSHS